MLRRFVTSAVAASILAGTSLLAAPAALAVDGGRNQTTQNRNQTTRNTTEDGLPGFRDSVCFFLPYACYVAHRAR